MTNPTEEPYGSANPEGPAGQPPHRPEEGPLVRAARRVEEAGEKAGRKYEEAKERISTAWESTRRTAAEAKDKDVGEIMEDVRTYVRRHPGRSILISFAAGFLLSGLFRN